MIWSDTLQDVVNSMDEIEPYLFLGGVGVISNNTYKTFNIRKVISVLGTERELQEVKNNLSEEDVNHTCILIRDNGRDPIEAYFESVSEEIKAAVDAQIPTLIHCHAGISRSATLTAAYIYKTRGYDYDQALKYLKVKRPAIDPAFGFIAKLASKYFKS